MLLEGTLVRSTLCRVLSVDVGIIFFAILGSMCKRTVDSLALNVDDGVERRGSKVIRQEVFKTVSAYDAAPVLEN